MYMCVYIYVCVCVCVCARADIHKQWRSKVPKSGGAHRHVIFVPSVKNQYKRVVWLFTNSHLCQFIEIVHKIINWYMKNAK